MSLCSSEQQEFAGEGKAGAEQVPSQGGPVWGGPKPGAQTHLSDADRSARQRGDAGQGAALPALRVSDHPAVSALQRDLPKLDSLSTWNTRFWLDNLVIQSTRMGEISAV